VSESTLTSIVAELRRLLGEGQGRSGGIETISKHGYRLIAPVEAGQPAPARLAVLPFDNLDRDPEEITSPTGSPTRSSPSWARSRACG
jgi:DNA-binding winged helix-turn-helix (wHTH) protein